eukprot:1178228-Prorocentrum_minimum.AAC.3
MVHAVSKGFRELPSRRGGVSHTEILAPYITSPLHRTLRQPLMGVQIPPLAPRISPLGVQNPPQNMQLGCSNLTFTWGEKSEKKPPGIKGFRLRVQSPSLAPRFILWGVQNSPKNPKCDLPPPPAGDDLQDVIYNHGTPKIGRLRNAWIVETFGHTASGCCDPRAVERIGREDKPYLRHRGDGRIHRHAEADRVQRVRCERGCRRSACTWNRAPQHASQEEKWVCNTSWAGIGNAGRHASQNCVDHMLGTCSPRNRQLAL